MKRSALLTKTLKETPADSDSINATYLTRAGFVKKNMAGVYALLPLGMKVYQKIENIIPEEMNKIEGQESFMNVMQSKDLWDETGRWNEMKDIMYQFKDVRGKDVGLGPTHEEQVTDIIRSNINSYKDLPVAVYQIQTKFRNEARAKSGLLRGREFVMKDLYSFHANEEDFNKYYKRAKVAYQKVFERCGFKNVKIVEADGGVFSKYSHEFQVLVKSGEDTIFHCDSCEFAQNKEIAEVKENDKCPKCDGKIVKSNAIEVGNIFPLKNKFSKEMNANFKNEEGEEKSIIMGCYGIGLTRVLASIVETSNDERGIIWPETVAPYKVNLISIDKNQEAEKIYQDLTKKGVEVLYDDRKDVSAGEKFADVDLIGCPYKVIVSERSINSGGAEIARRDNKESKVVPFDEIENNLK